MCKEKLTFKNFNDEEVTVTLRFNLSEIELMDLVKDDPTFSQAYFNSLIENSDAYEMFRFVRKILALSYGELSNDGNTFMKSPEIMDKFLHSASYDALISKIADSENVDILKTMLIGIFPAKFAQAFQGLDKPEAVTAENA